MTYEELEKTEKSDEIYDDKNWRNISPNVFLSIEYADSEEMACEKASIRTGYNYGSKTVSVSCCPNDIFYSIEKIIIDELDVSVWLPDKNGNIEHYAAEDFEESYIFTKRKSAKRNKK